MQGARIFAFLSALAFLSACEHSDTCTDAEAQRLGDACGRAHLFSTFPDEDPLSREVSGRVLRGKEYVEGALVHLAPSSDFGTDLGFDPRGEPLTIRTDAAGFYRFSNAPLAYDLSIRTDTEISIFRGMHLRYVEPSIGGDSAPRAFSAPLDVTIDPPPPPGTTVAFFASGTQAVNVTGNLTSGVVATFRSFATRNTCPPDTTRCDPPLRINAVLFPEGSTVASATASGFADVDVHEGDSTPVHIVLTALPPIPSDVQIAARIPSGFVPSTVELFVDFGLRASRMLAASGPIGGMVRVASIPNARYALHVRAEKDGAVSDSGLFFFDPTRPLVDTNEPTLFDPPTLEAPLADEGVQGATLTADASASTDGHAMVLRDHILAPESGGGPAVHVLTMDRSAVLPDLAPLGLPALSGRYVWTVTAWPDRTQVEDMAGADVRVFPYSTSAPRVVVIH